MTNLQLLTPLSADNMPTAEDLYVTPLNEMGVITLAGEDNKHYLQGQVTCDVTKLPANEFINGTHCDAKGKVWSIFKLFEQDAALYMLMSQDELASSCKELQKFGVFSKSEIVDATANFAIYGVNGNRAKTWLEAVIGVNLEEDTNFTSANNMMVLHLSSDRYLLVCNTEQSEQVAEAAKNHLFDSSFWHFTSIKAGEPHLSSATINQHVPQALNQHLLNAISFEKGCYIGQEMVARMKFLGKNKRATYALTGNATSLDSAKDLEVKMGENWRRSGTIVNQAHINNESVLLAILPKDTEQNAVFRIKGDDESEFTLMSLPYSFES